MIKTSLRNDAAGVTDMRRMSEKGEDLYTRWAKIRYESWKKSSILAQADAECEVRSQIESCFNVSLESIIDACRMINELTTINSHYAVIRTAVEASATGVWLSTVGKKRKMIFYSIKLSYRDNENMLSLAEQSPTPNRALIDNRRQKRELLEEQKQHLRGYETKDIKTFPQYTQILKTADERIRQRKTYTAVMAWRICSSLAHGSRDNVIGLAEAIPTGRGDARTEEVEIKQNPLLSFRCLNPAAENCERILKEYERAIG